MVRILQSFLPSLTVSLQGLKSVLTIMEEKFSIYKADEKPPIILKFEESSLSNNFRLSNDINTNEYRVEGNFDMKAIFTTLLDSQPPNCDALKAEGSGSALVDIFIKQTEAEFKPLIKSPGDENALNGISANVLRVTCDFYWASFICSFLTSEGILTDAKTVMLHQKLKDILEQGAIIIDNEILDPVFKFVRYCLLGSFHLNEFATGADLSKPQVNLDVQKRKRIIERMANGLTARKRRRFSISKVNEALQSISKYEIEEQLNLLVSHVIIEKPTRKSACLVRNLSNDAETYLKEHCQYNDQELRGLKRKIAELVD